MIQKALAYLFEMKRPEKIEVDGFTHVIQGYNRFSPPLSTGKTVHTLQGLVDMLESHNDNGQFNMPVIHIESADTVSIFSRLDAKHRGREDYSEAKLTGKNFAFGQYHDIEQFIIGIQAQFVQDENARLVMQKVGTITQDARVTTLDDGMSQSTTAKKGTAGVEHIILPNPITLRPYRTFREVEQPASNFVLRIKEGNRVALFEADGGAWELEAIDNVAKWLKNATENQYPVIA